MKKKPNFLYIGPDKAGSTWIYQVLRWHPEVFVTQAKDLYYFDKFYYLGSDWYLKHFGKADNEKIIAEISHDYLYSREAMLRIYQDLPDVKLMVCLREPVDRAFSAYLYLVRHGLFEGTFEEALCQFPELIDRGLYSKYLRPYLELFGKDRIFIGIFDELKNDPKVFLKKLFQFLNISILEIPEELLQKALPAARARSLLIAKFAKKVALTMRSLGLAELVGKMKSLTLIHKILYIPYSDDDKPFPKLETKKKLQEYYRNEIEELDKLLGLNFLELWGYL